ncbi:GNAT family N-acetyltransferase [Parapedobacter deserti]|uniref:GNAT family N-acetyltransferase n=1 Tax=Parapedobacter deserti TaxID=1912957 RepID=A0ABV7JNF5_9SPHI
MGYHRDYLAKWLVDEGLPYSLDEIWQIREECIKEIAMKQCELTTDRLMMRPFRAEDSSVMYALNEDPEVLQYTGDVQFEDVAAEYDIGYRFFKQHWGKGYATESAKAAMDYGFGTLKLDRIIGRARVENPASINVFNKLGMRFVEPYTEKGQNWVLYEVVKEI